MKYEDDPRYVGDDRAMDAIAYVVAAIVIALVLAGFGAGYAIGRGIVG